MQVLLMLLVELWLEDVQLIWKSIKGLVLMEEGMDLVWFKKILRLFICKDFSNTLADVWFNKVLIGMLLIISIINF